MAKSKLIKFFQDCTNIEISVDVTRKDKEIETIVVATQKGNITPKESIGLIKSLAFSRMQVKLASVEN